MSRLNKQSSVELFMDKISPSGGVIRQGCSTCDENQSIKNPIPDTENVSLLMQRSDEAKRYKCFFMEIEPWGDDFEDETRSRYKWDTIASLEELYYQTGTQSPDYQSQRRGCLIECATTGNISHIEYKKPIPSGTIFRGEIEFHADWCGDALLWDWKVNFGHLCWFKWYVTDGTNNAGLSWYSENGLEEDPPFFIQNMGYFLNGTRNITNPSFPLDGYNFSSHTYTGHRYAIERKIDGTIDLYHWSNQLYFHDGSGEWILAGTVPADFFIENSELRFGIYLLVNGHVNPGSEEYNKIGYDNFVVPIIPQ